MRRKDWSSSPGHALRAAIAHTALSTLVFAAMTMGARAAVDISAKPTKNMSCSAGVCTPTAKRAVLNAAHLAHLLKSADIEVVTGSGAVSIVVTAGLSWSSSRRLTLDAASSVGIQAQVVVAGAGGMTIVTDDGGTGGDLQFLAGATIDFWDLRGSLVVNGRSYTLVNDIVSLADDVAFSPSGSYALTRNYDAAPDGTFPTSPIGTPFAGSFEGLGHSIANLHIAYSQPESMDIGLFRHLGAGGQIRDLVVSNPQIHYSATANYTGALTGTSAGDIANIQVIGGEVDGGTCAGGLAGSSSGTILRSSVEGTTVGVGSHAAAGGLVCGSAGSIVSSHSNATVEGATASGVGALAAGNNGGLISLSYAGGVVYGGSARFGNDGNGEAAGLVAYNYGTIDRSFSTVTVNGGHGAEGETHQSYVYVGGLVSINRGAIRQSYFRGSVGSGYDGDVGGVVGVNAYQAGVDSSYSTGSVTCSSCGGSSEFGGVIGDDTPSHTVADSYWDLQTSGISDPSNGAGYPKNDEGLTGLTTAAFLAGLPQGFDRAVWAEDAAVNDGYPYLIANKPPG